MISALPLAEPLSTTQTTAFSLDCARSSKRARRQSANSSLTFQLTMTTAKSGFVSLTVGFWKAK